MKNRRSIIVAFLVVALLVAGIGYAAVSVELDIEGNASYVVKNATDDFNSEVYFSKAVVTKSGSGSRPDTVGNVVTGAKVVTFTVNSLNYVGEEAVFTFTVTNDSVTPVNVTFANTFASDYYDVTFTNFAQIGTGENNTEDVVVTVRLKKLPTADHTAKLGDLTLTVEPPADLTNTTN